MLFNHQYTELETQQINTLIQRAIQESCTTLTELRNTISHDVHMGMSLNWEHTEYFDKLAQLDNNYYLEALNWMYNQRWPKTNSRVYPEVKKVILIRQGN